MNASQDNECMLFLWLLTWFASSDTARVINAEKLDGYKKMFSGQSKLENGS